MLRPDPTTHDPTTQFTTQFYWAATKSRIEELQASGKKWFIVLLFKTPKNGYLLTSKDVERYINEGLWPMGKDKKNKNEYKISPGKALQHKHRFYTFDDFINSLINNISNTDKLLKQIILNKNIHNFLL